MTDSANKYFMTEYKFSGCIPLKHLFGFCEDNKKMLLNCNQQLILNLPISMRCTFQSLGQKKTFKKIRK